MRWLLALLLACITTTAPGQEQNTRPLQPLGVFSAIRNTDDHTYGQRTKLWYRGTMLIGEVSYWDGNLDAQRGRFIDGHINIRTGEVRFRVVLVRQDVQPHIRTAAAFEGLLVKGQLAGKFVWQGEAAKTRGKNGVEDWRMRYDKSDVLEPFASVEAWQQAHAQ